MKNKLTIMNEVLPEPTRMPDAPSPVRARVLERLKQLSVQAAGLSAVSACIGYGCVDPLPDPVACADTTPTRWLYPSSVTGDAERVVARFTLANSTEITGLRFNGAYVIRGGQVADRQSPSASILNLGITPDGTPIKVLVYVTLGCDGVAAERVASFLIEDQDGLTITELGVGIEGVDPDTVFGADGGVSTDGGASDAGM